MRGRTGRVRVRGRRARGLARVGALLAAGLVAAGCGIPTTGVVEAGEPASGIRPLISLYFVLPDGSLAVRQRSTGGLNGVTDAVALLLKGLSAPEAKIMGLTSLLPPDARGPAVRTGHGSVRVDLRAGAAPLDPRAVDQVVCTAAAAYRAVTPGAGDVHVTVSVAGTPQEGSPDQTATCSAAARSWPFPGAGQARPPEADRP